jgi:uncharacterized membrane protein HdeD (DUF308 family)
VHPYRTPSFSAPEPAAETQAGDARLAFQVLAAVSAIQVATSLPDHGVVSAQTLVGAALLAAGVGWLAAHRRT